MRCLVLHSYTPGPGSLQVEERPTPVPRSGEVLIEVAASPINPSDLGLLAGIYGDPRPLPLIPGFEGSGTVAAAGGGLLARRLVGRRVAFAVAGGAWAEYVTAPALQCLELPEEISLHQGAMALVNPLTALAILDIARRAGARALVHTAAASALGRMLVRLSLRTGLPIIHVVRRPEQVALLKSRGAVHVLDSSEPDFLPSLAALCGQLDARLAFDAVAGEMTGRLLAAMGRGARVVVYGALSRAPCQVHFGDLIMKEKRVEGLHLSNWLASRSKLVLLRAMRTVRRLIATDLQSEVAATFPLEQVDAALSQYMAGMTRGKVLLTPR